MSPDRPPQAPASGVLPLLQQLNTHAVLLRLLVTLAEARVADCLAEAPQTAAQVARERQLHAGTLYRMLRFVASFGFFREDADGRFHLTPMAEALRSDVPGSVRDRLRQPWHDLLWRCYQHLPDTLHDGSSAFELSHGQPIFDYMAAHPDVNAIFDRSMARLSQVENPIVASACAFPRTGLVVDVAGGQGGLLAAVLESNPGLRGLLYDQSQVVAAPDALCGPGVVGRWQAQAGDFFASVPKGGDVYLLKRIMHDWDDERALMILRNCHAAMTRESRLLIIDAVIAPGNDPDPNKFLDINMLTLTNGRERTAIELRTLCAAAGLAVERLLPLPSPATLTVAETRLA